MGLFDIFKKKQTGNTFPENELEHAFMHAASNVSVQKEFYQKLLWNQLIVLREKKGDLEDGVHTLEKDTSLRLVTYENGHIPVFTSANRIFDKGVVKGDVTILGIKGQDLFGLAKGATFVLNPYSDYWKELIPAEIESLMDGTIYDKIDDLELEKEKAETFNKLFEQACKKQEGLIILDGYQEPKAVNPDEQLILEAALEDFRKCLEMSPDHWQSMFMMAKGLQRLKRHAEALEQLESAFKIEPANHFIPMEAALEAMYLKDTDKALFYSGESLKRKPNDFALMGNHAMNLLHAKETMKRKQPSVKH